MKKTIFLLALILPVCSLVAQPPAVSSLPDEGIHHSMIYQNGDNNEATVTQDGLTNWSLIKTTDGGNIDVIDQNGGTNYSYLYQNKKNQAYVTQTSEQEKPHNINLSWINQPGKRNVATAVQDHNGSTAGPDKVVLEAYIWQSGNDNTATQLQGPAPEGESKGLWATTVQSGNDNDAYQKQKKDNNRALILQQGDNNGAEQRQDLGNDGASNNHAFIWQSGDDNRTATQVQNGDNNWAIAIVPGDGNSSNQEQGKSDGSKLAVRDLAVVYQAGNHNDADQYQYGTENIAASGQWGNKNTSYQKQDGTQNLAISVQTGNGTHAKKQTAYQKQTGTRNLAGILQEGNKGEAKQIQSNDGAIFWPPNVAVIYQTGGADNIAHQTQTRTGDGSGIPNLAFAHQDGSDNQSYQTQTGGFNVSGVYQNGDGNIANVVQTALPPPPLP